MYNKLLIVFLILLFGLILFQFLGNRIEGFTGSYDFTSSNGSKASVADDVAIITTARGNRITYNKTTTTSDSTGDTVTYTDSHGNIAVINIPKSGTNSFYTQKKDGTNKVTYSPVIGFNGIYNFKTSDGIKAAVSSSTAVITKTDNTRTVYQQHSSENKDGGIIVRYKDASGNKAVFKMSGSNTQTFYTENADGTNKVTYSIDTAADTIDADD